MEEIKQIRVIETTAERRKKGTYVIEVKREVEFTCDGQLYRRVIRERKKSQEIFFIFKNEKHACEDELEVFVEVAKEDEKEEAPEALTEATKEKFDLSIFKTINKTLKARGLGMYEPILKVYGEDDDLKGDFYIKERMGDLANYLEFEDYEGVDQLETIDHLFHDGPIEETLKKMDEFAKWIWRKIPGTKELEAMREAGEI